MTLDEQFAISLYLLDNVVTKCKPVKRRFKTWRPTTKSRPQWSNWI